MKPTAISVNTDQGYCIALSEVSRVAKEIAGLKRTTFTGKILLSSAARSVCFTPAPLFCTKDGQILQLWYEMYSGKKQWRPLMSFEQATAYTGCEVIDEISSNSKG